MPPEFENRWRATDLPRMKTGCVKAFWLAAAGGRRSRVLRQNPVWHAASQRPAGIAV